VKVRLGTRGSRLALAQSTLVADALRAATGYEVELVEIVTPGDTSSAPIADLGVGVFVSALRDALLAGQVDLAVHSYKDLPTAAPDGLLIAAVPLREDPRDALVARDGLTLAQLPAGATVGTCSVRRVAALRALGLPVRTVPLRGNVDTRLRRVRDGELDAVILARAGLLRLGRADAVTEILDPALMLPAPAQGALALECRAGDRDLCQVLALLDDVPSRAAVDAERALLATLEAGCSAPVAALAVVTQDEFVPAGQRAQVARSGSGPDDRRIQIRAAVYSPDGLLALRLDRSGSLAEAGKVGRLLAEDLLGSGAADLIAPARPRPA